MLQPWNRSFRWNPYPSITLNELIFFENRSRKWKTSRWPTGTMYLKKWIISNNFTFHLSSQPSCLPSLLLLSLSVPSQKHSPQQSLTMTLFIILQFPITLLTIQYGILPTPIYSSANEASFLAFIDKNSTILISLDDYYTLSHAGLRRQEPYHLFLFRSTLYPFQPSYPLSDCFTNHLISRLMSLDGIT